MYPHDNIFNIYYNIDRRTPFLVKRCERGLMRSQTEERRIDPNKDRTYLVEKVYPRGKYGKAFGKSYVDGILDESFGGNSEIPCAGCGEWVLIEVPGVSLEEIFPPIEQRKIDFGKYKGLTYRDIKEDRTYLEWLVSINKLSREDLDNLLTEVNNIGVDPLLQTPPPFGLLP